MSNYELFFGVLSAFLLSAFLVGFYRHLAIRHGFEDIPNERSSHSIVTPRGGGIACLIAWVLVSSFFFSRFSIVEIIVLYPCSMLVAAVGLYDDLFQIGAGKRAVVHIFAAAVMLSSLLFFGPPAPISISRTLVIILVFCTILAIAWSVNLYNFMDGMDGIAATEAIFIFGIGGYFIWHKTQSALGFSALLLASTLTGFLLWNRPPAKIFMGDVGSGFLGFLVAAFAIVAFLKYDIPIAVWIILYGLFWYDASLTLMRRIFAREKWYAAHRSHAYQRLHHIANWSHARVLSHAIVLNAVLGIFALIGYYYQSLLELMILLTFVFLTVSFSWIEKIAPFKLK